MIDSIYVALTGLRGCERGLKVIANNTSNLNTPGFKGSSLLFADMYSTGTGPGGTGQGLGLTTPGTVVAFQQGQFQSTGNDLDLAVDGLGFFMLRDASGTIRYTRDGQFKFDENGILVTTKTQEQVLSLEPNGGYVPISIADMRTQAALATSRVTFGGTLSTSAQSATLDNVTVTDRSGTSHALTVQFQRATGASNAWTVTVRDGETTLECDPGQISFQNGQPDPDACEVSFALPGQEPEQRVTLDFRNNVQSYAMGGSGTLAVASQNGHGPGTLKAVTFDALGALTITYSNDQTEKGARLALGRFSSPDAVQPAGDNHFEVVDPGGWLQGVAGDIGFGKIRSAALEMSNVDLSTEFSDLVIMQRGYQAASQVVSTANEMLADLFAIKGK